MKCLTLHLDHLKGDPWLGERVSPEAIAEVHLDRHPPEVHLSDGRIGVVSREHVQALEHFALHHNLRAVTRLDVWAALLERYLDTEIDEARQASLNQALQGVGFTPEELSTLYSFLEPWMIAWTAITWEWGHYGMMDLLDAVPRNFSSLLGAHDPILPAGVSRAAVRTWAESLARRGAPGERVTLPLPVEDGAAYGSLWWSFPCADHPLDALALKSKLESLKNALLDHWRAPHRHYHNEVHLRRVLASLQGRSEGETALRLAAWFHDAIYDTTRSDNEEASAQWLEREASFLVEATTATAEDVAEAARIVRATAKSLEPIPASDTLVRRFWDADFGIFGAAPVVYDAYVAQVRAEWGHVSDEAFRQGRLRFLQTLLEAVEARGFFFYEDHAPFSEAMARANLAREMGALKAL